MIQQRLDALCASAASSESVEALEELLRSHESEFGAGSELSYALEDCGEEGCGTGHAELTPGQVIEVWGRHQILHLFLDNSRISSKPLFRSWAPRGVWQSVPAE